MMEYTAATCDTLAERRALFESFGGLPETTVLNTEWLYMLEQDTRHSLAIEGHFATEEELEAVLKGTRSDQDIANYFRIAQTVYDQGLQYYRDQTLRLDVPLVRHIHSELFRELDPRRGEFRKGGIQILGAKAQPPEFDPEFDVAAYIKAALTIIEADIREQPILTALARAHTLFKSIHPFHDGNGRLGRILLNYLAISKGYPPIVIKGITVDERRRYYQVLEAADVGFHGGFPAPRPDLLRERLAQGVFDPLQLLLCEGLLPRLDTLIALALERQTPLLDLVDVSAQLGVKEGTLRQRIARGKLIALKRGKKLYTHPRLALPGHGSHGSSLTPSAP